MRCCPTHKKRGKQVMGAKPLQSSTGRLGHRQRAERKRSRPRPFRRFVRPFVRFIVRRLIACDRSRSFAIARDRLRSLAIVCDRLRSFAIARDRSRSLAIYAVARGGLPSAVTRRAPCGRPPYARSGGASEDTSAATVPPGGAERTVRCTARPVIAPNALSGGALADTRAATAPPGGAGPRCLQK